jgi:hypothetical protein
MDCRKVMLGVGVVLVGGVYGVSDWEDEVG